MHRLTCWGRLQLVGFYVWSPGISRISSNTEIVTFNTSVCSSSNSDTLDCVRVLHYSATLAACESPLSNHKGLFTDPLLQQKICLQLLQVNTYTNLVKHIKKIYLVHVYVYTLVFYSTLCDKDTNM